ncbi:MAG: hypothetical protein HY028_04595 [Gammaproteobacteria bacterium]|nr:hypothetical protein [Gammaproteobacteria bacterium]
MQQWDEFMLGRDADPIEVSTSADQRNAALSSINQSKRALTIYSRDLDHAVYDNPELVEAVRQLAIRSRVSEIKILVQNSERIVQQGHRLIELSRRLESLIKIRKVTEEYHHYNGSFLVVDRRGVIHNKTGESYRAIVNFNAPSEAALLLNFFDEVWERSEPDPELRALGV